MTDPIPARLAALKTTPMPELKAAVARAVRHRAAAVQPPLPGEPARLSHPGTGLWRPEARDDPAAGGARRAARRRQRRHPPHPRRRPADRRHAADPRVAGRRARRSPCAPTTSSGRAGPTGRSPPSPAPSPARAGTAGCSSASGAGQGQRGMTKPVTRKLRCAVYTRKSTEEGLEQEFNSPRRPARGLRGLHRSQRSEGWVLVRDRYDDGGFSGGTLERPALKRLLADIEDGLVDVVVVYKIDRLSPLADGLRQAGRGVRRARRDLRLGHAVVQHHDLHGAADAEHPALLRPVRARGHRRAHPRQDRGLAPEGHVDGRQGAARLRRRGPQAGGERGRGGDRARRSSSASSRSARRRCWRRSCGARACAASAAARSTRATSTSC